MDAHPGPIPSPDPVSQPFWDAAQDERLALPRCDDCNRVHWYPRVICPFCHSTNIDWVDATGKGTIHTFAVQHNRGLVARGWGEHVPYVSAYIDLAEGDRMLGVLSNVDPNDPDSIKIGSAVEIHFLPGGEDGFKVPYWRVV